MKVLILGSKEYPMGTNDIDNNPSGGYEIYIENIVKEFAQLNIESVIITRQFRRTLIKEHQTNIEIHRVPWINGFLFRNISFNFTSFIRSLKLNFDIIFTKGPVATFFGYFISKIKGKRMISCPGGIGFIQPQYNRLIRFLYYCLERFSYSREVDIIFLSKEEMRQFIEKLGFSPKSRYIIPPGINVIKINLQEKKKILSEFNINEEIIISYIGRLIDIKGIEYLIKAINGIKAKNIKLLIIGSGIQTDYLKRISIDFKIEDKIIFTGFRSDVYTLLSITDIFVLPSLSEGLPLSLLEAMGMGCACIVTDIGLPVQHLHTGIVIPTKNSDAISNAINLLIYDKQLRDRIQKESKEFAEMNYSWNSSARQLVAVMENNIRYH